MTEPHDDDSFDEWQKKRRPRSGRLILALIAVAILLWVLITSFSNEVAEPDSMSTTHITITESETST